MKKPKLPKRVFFVDEDGFKVSEKEAWKNTVLLHPPHQIRITVGGIPRCYRLDNNGDIVRVMSGEFHLKADPGVEEAVDEFLYLAMMWLKEQDFERKRRTLRRERARSFPETNRVMAPSRFKGNPAQSRLSFRNKLRV